MEKTKLKKCSFCKKNPELFGFTGDIVGGEHTFKICIKCFEKIITNLL